MRSAELPAPLTRLSHVDAAWAEATPGTRLAAVRRAARALHDHLSELGPAACVRTFDLVTFPYPTSFGLGGAARSPAPYVMMRNRMQLVQVASGGGLITVLINPTDAERSLAAPFFARQIERYGNFVARRVMSTTHGTVAQALATWGVAPSDVDYITFDHLHVQDVRGLLGTETIPALLPRARLLVQRPELAAFAAPHPLQRHWYVAGGLDGVPADRIVVLDGDVLIGPGLALIRTPGHTAGNHTPTLVTDRGVWTISENGIAVDAYAPESSRIAGLRAHARDTDVEVVLNANTRENTLDQYTSMVLEKTLADPCPDRPEFPQHFPSSELTRHPLAPGLAPTYTHGAITYGQVSAGRRSGASAA
jgi:glyoxylase-like metal-dependent hydrolase (beta-lactamase superfamily II)